MYRIGERTAMDLGTLGNISAGQGNLMPEVRKSARKPEISREEHDAKLDSVRQRMKSGYYQSREVNEAISDKLSGAFDKLA